MTRSTAATNRTSPRQDRARTRPHRFQVLTANFFVLMLNYGDRAAIGVATPVMIHEFGFSKSTFGWVLAAFAFSYSPFGFIGGWLADKFGPRNAMAVAVTVWSMFTALTAAGVGFLSLLLIRIGFGAGEGPQATVTAKLMHNWFPRKERGTALGIANAATPLGGAVGTPIVAAIMSATHDNWRVSFIILGVIGGFALVGWLAIVRDAPTLSTENHQPLPEHGKQPGAEITVDPEDTAAGAHQWGRYLARPPVWATALAYFGYSWILWTFLNWFPTYLIQQRGINLDQLAFTGAIPWVGGFVGLVAGGIITDWLVHRSGNPLSPRRHLVVVCLTVTALLFGTIPLVSSVWAAVTLMSAVIFFLYLTGAQYWTIIGEAVPSRCYGSVSGVVQMFATIPAILAPIVTGYLIDSTLGWPGTFALAAIIALIGTALLATTGRKPDKMTPA